MRYMKTFKIFESRNQEVISIDDFLQKIRVPNHLVDSITNWWRENRPHIKIHFFPFQSNKPIAGVFLGEDTICINESLPMPPHMRLFLALHESRHCDQHSEGRFMEGYYNTVVRGDKDSFLISYKELEKDANDFAILSMGQCGFTREMDSEEIRIRGNERAGEMVYQMMKSDIERYQPDNFFDLLKSQIGI